MKFSLRDLLLVTVIVALAVAWWVDRAKLRARIHELEPNTFLETMNQIEYSGWAEHAPKYELKPNSSAPAPNPPKP